MDQTTERVSSLPPTAARVFPGDGEMAEMMRTTDWSRTPLGPVEDWPQSLCTAVSICLASRFPILIWWGGELTMLYNDAYRLILGSKHPAALGAPGRRVWPEIWHIIGPMLEGVLGEGKATWSDDQFLPLERSGYAEECYFTFSYSPIHDESGGIGGIFCAVTETTARVLGERRARVARDLAAATVDAHTAEEVCERAVDALASDAADIPLARLYLIEPDGKRLRLAASSGGKLGGSGDTQTAHMPSEPEIRAALARTAQTDRQEPIVFQPADGRGTMQRDGDAPAPRRALILPITEPGQGQPSAVLVAGVNPLRALDDEYQGFYELLVAHLGAGLAAAHAYDEARKRAAALAELDRAKTAFFSNVSHEFRTPLTLLLGPLEDALADGADPLSPRQRERQLLERRNALRLLKLVNTLLDFSRTEAGRANAVYEPVDLAAYTADLASAFRSVVEHAGLRFTVVCEPLAVAIYVDRAMWEKIVFNLLSNAFKFTLRGEIALTLRQRGRRVTLEVRDTGVGIAADEMPRLFERFHQIQNAEARTNEGSGIGLALVQELVRMHGGSISAQSRPEVGTTFTVTIPAGTRHLPPEHVRAAPVQAPTALGAAPYVEEAMRWLDDDVHQPSTISDPLDAAPSPLSQHAPPHADAARGEARLPARILVADDNADMRDYLRRLLADRGYTVETVRDGLDALAAAREDVPDLLLSDVMMPRLDGMGLVQAWRADPRLRAVPVILLSARAGEDATVSGLAAGADDYLVKPFSAPELLARVAARLEIARAERAALARAHELEATFEAIADAVFIYDREGYIVRTNAAARTLLGLDTLPGYGDLSPEQRAALVATHDEQGRVLSPAQSGLARLLNGEVLTGPKALTLRLRLPGGRELDVNITGAPLLDETGAIVGAIAVSRDVTERLALERRTHETLGAMLAMARGLVALEPDAQAAAELHMPHGSGLAHRLAELTRDVLGCRRVSIHLVERETRLRRPVAVVGLPPELEAAWWAEQEALEVRYGEDAGPDDQARLEASGSVVVDMRQPPYDQMPNPYGMTTVLIVPMRVRDEVVGVLALDYEDELHPFPPGQRVLAEAVAQLAALVLERERLLSEREEARASALAFSQANQRMDEFLSIASHELKTPVTTIKTNLNLIERRLRRVARAKDAVSLEEVWDTVQAMSTLAERADRGMTRLVRLVDDLVDVSRIRAGRLDLRLEPCDLRAIVLECIENERTANPAREVRLRMLNDEPILLTADADRIAQVVTNYLTNALKYSSADAPVEVSVARERADVRVSVRDEGQGLPPQERERIWEMFHRAPSVRVLTGSGIGLGLGLHICKTIIERHGGQVGMESAEGQGSTFWFTLPLSDRAAG